MAAFLKGALDGFGHFKLAGAVLVREGGAREDAARSEELVQGGQGAGWVFAGGHRNRVLSPS